jgi:SAM-dependent methyltransferase
MEPRYDAHATWYEEYLQGAAQEHTARTSAALSSALGCGTGVCLDVGCGTGVHAAALHGQGWRVVGVDLSQAQLRYALARLPVAAADASSLPFRTAAVDAVAASLIHTDVSDWEAVLREVARVLRPGGKFAYVGVHPCFVGPFAERSEHALVLHPGYTKPGLMFDGPGIGKGIRPRVGVWHRTLTGVLNAVTAAGLTVDSVQELDPGGGFPDLLVVQASQTAPTDGSA